MKEKRITENLRSQAGREGETTDLVDELFEVANLYPSTTGLPMTVWVSTSGNARHDVRVKVNMTHGNQMSIANTAVFSVRPVPRIVAGRLSPDDERAVCRWVSLNTAALIEYWEGRIDTVQLGQRLQPLSPGALRLGERAGAGCKG